MRKDKTGEPSERRSARSGEIRDALRALGSNPFGGGGWKDSTSRLKATLMRSVWAGSERVPLC